METAEPRFVPITDLFGRSRLMSGEKPLDEWRTFIKFFSEELHRSPAFIGHRLAHFKNEDIGLLYELQSNFKDRLRRPCGPCLKEGMTGPCEHSRATAEKFWWWATKTRRV